MARFCELQKNQHYCRTEYIVICGKIASYRKCAPLGIWGKNADMASWQENQNSKSGKNAKVGNFAKI